MWFLRCPSDVFARKRQCVGGETARNIFNVKKVEWTENLAGAGVRNEIFFDVIKHEACCNIGGGGRDASSIQHWSARAKQNRNMECLEWNATEEIGNNFSCLSIFEAHRECTLSTALSLFSVLNFFPSWKLLRKNIKLMITVSIKPQDISIH